MSLPRPSPPLHQLFCDLGDVLYQQGDLAAAADSYRQAVSLSADAHAYHSLGVVLDQQGRSQSAIHSYQQALALQPDATLYSNLGCALSRIGQLEAAIESYRQGLALDSNSSILCYNLAQALFAQGKVSEAIVAYQDAIERQPDFVAACHHLGKALQFQGDHLQAIGWFKQASSIAPDGAVWGDCAVSWMAQGDFAAAIECFRKAIGHQPQFVTSFCDRAIPLTGQDDLTLAKIACAKFLLALRSIDPLHPQPAHEVYRHLQQTYLQLGKVLTQYGGSEQQAAVYYNNALAIDRYLQPSQLEKREDVPLASSSKSPAGQPKGCYRSTWEWVVAAGVDCRCYVALDGDLRLKTLPEGGTVGDIAPQPLQGRQNLQHDAKLNCEGLNCLPCLTQIFRWFEPTHLGHHLYACDPSAVLPPLPPLSQFVATIAGGRVWTVPQQNDWLICNAIAVVAPDDRLLADLSRDYPGRLPGCKNAAPHRILEQILPPVESIAGTVAVLSGLSGHIYFHWMVDILPRLELLRRGGFDWAAIDWFLLNYSDQSFQRETLAALGILAEKILSSDRHPHIQGTLIAPAFAGHLGWLQPWALQFLRQMFLPKAVSKNLPKRVYISRSRASYRRVLNEAEVVETLAHAGFVAIVLESLSFAEQVALFANAEAIVAPHGSGLTNLAFCSPHTQVVEIVSPHYIRHYYWLISHHLHLQHYYLVAEGFACAPLRDLMYQNSLTEDILVDIFTLKKMINTVFK